MRHSHPRSPAPRGRACAHRIGTGAGCVWQWTPLPQTPWSWVNGPPSCWRSPLARARWGTHSSILRDFECGSPFPRDCAPDFFPTKSGGTIFFQPFSFGHPCFIRSLRDRLAGSCAVLRCPLTPATNGQRCTAAAALFAILSTTGWYKEARLRRRLASSHELAACLSSCIPFLGSQHQGGAGSPSYRFGAVQFAAASLQPRCRLAAAQLPLSCRSAAAQLPLSC
jgi:hypothetical protein